MTGSDCERTWHAESIGGGQKESGKNILKVIYHLSSIFLELAFFTNFQFQRTGVADLDQFVHGHRNLTMINATQPGLIDFRALADLVSGHSFLFDQLKAFVSDIPVFFIFQQTFSIAHV